MKISLLLMLSLFYLPAFSQIDFENVELDNVVTKVQPMTGIVLWDTGKSATDAISLEYSYMLFKNVVTAEGVYDWTAVENKLDAIASRGHQAIFRFRYTYPGFTTSVPQYIKDREDYDETVGKSEGRTTYFPDWTNEELMRFTLEFYTKFSEKYDTDPRLAFIQVGFGLWAEYHIYDGPFTLGETFPSKTFQETFFKHLDTTFTHIPWSISIDASDSKYSPFNAKPDLLNIDFGLFDDSFMHKSHSGYNTSCWNFFDRNRYTTSPAGGEFSYYSDYDQENVLNYPDGPYNESYESFAERFHITYMIGNDQTSYQTNERIKQASMASGYRFKVESLKTAADTSVFEILNYGVAPIYYDAYIAIDGVRSEQSLKSLQPGDTQMFSVSAGAKDAVVTIESDKLVPGQEIQFYGTQDMPSTSVIEKETLIASKIYPNPISRGDVLRYEGGEGLLLNYAIYNSQGVNVFSGTQDSDILEISTRLLSVGIYFVEIKHSTHKDLFKIIVV